MHHLNLPSSNIINSDAEHAMRVRLTQINSKLAKQKPNLNSTRINCIKSDRTPTPQVHLTQNQLTPSQQVHTFESNTPNLNISDGDFDPRVRFAHNKLTLAGHNPILFIQSYYSHNSNALFSTQSNPHQVTSKPTSQTNTINTPLQIEPQIALFETQNTGKASLAYQN